LAGEMALGIRLSEAEEAKQKKISDIK